MEQSPFETKQIPELQEKLKIFESLYPNGSIRKVQRKDLPQNVINSFEGYSRRFIRPEEYKDDNFTHYFLIQHNHIPDFKTYVGEQNKIYNHLEEDEILEKNVYFIDMLGVEEVGHGELRFQPNCQDPYFKDHPFVGWSGTEDEYQRHGFATDRLFEMGAYSEMQWGLPLYSGGQNETADTVWQELIKQGKAKEVEISPDAIRKRYQLVLK